MKSETVRLFQTLPHACGYFAARTAQNLVIDPASPHLAQIYDVALLPAATAAPAATSTTQLPPLPGLRAGARAGR